MSSRLNFIHPRTLCGMLLSILEADKQLSLEDALSEYSDTQNIMVCILYGTLKSMTNDKIYWLDYTEDNEQLSGVVYGAIDIQRSVQENTFADSKFYCSSPTLSVRNDFYKMVGQAIYSANCIEHKEVTNKLYKFYLINFKYDLKTEFSLDVDFYELIDYCDRLLSIPDMYDFEFLIKACKFIFENYAVTNRNSKSKLPTIASSYEYIIQQFVIAELRRERSRRLSTKGISERYKGYRTSLLDKSRTIRKASKDNPLIKGLQADGVFKLYRGSDLVFADIIDVKTNLFIADTDSNGAIVYRPIYASATDNENQLIRYTKTFNELNGIDAFGYLVYVVFDIDSTLCKLHKTVTLPSKETGEFVTWGSFVINLNNGEFNKDTIRAQFKDLYDFLDIELHLK